MRRKEAGIPMMKVGIIRCQQTEDMCPGNTDFKVAKEGKMAFENTGPVEVIGFVSCGGCPGKKQLQEGNSWLTEAQRQSPLLHVSVREIL